MISPTKNEKTIGITGASGALGKELTKLFRQKGYKVIGFTHSKTNYEKNIILNLLINNFTNYERYIINWFMRAI